MRCSFDRTSSTFHSQAFSRFLAAEMFAFQCKYYSSTWINVTSFSQRSSFFHTVKWPDASKRQKSQTPSALGKLEADAWLVGLPIGLCLCSWAHSFSPPPRVCPAVAVSVLVVFTAAGQSSDRGRKSLKRESLQWVSLAPVLVNLRQLEIVRLSRLLK